MNHVPGRLSGNMIFGGVLGGLLGRPVVVVVVVVAAAAVVVVDANSLSLSLFLTPRRSPSAAPVILPLQSIFLQTP